MTVETSDLTVEEILVAEGFSHAFVDAGRMAGSETSDIGASDVRG